MLRLVKARNAGPLRWICRLANAVGGYSPDTFPGRGAARAGRWFPPMDERDLVCVARSQFGLITRQQALAHGVTARMIRTRLDTGRWSRLRDGVYAVGAPPETWEQQVLAACLAAGPDAVASHRTALRIWGFVGAAGRIEVTVVGRRRVRLPRATVHQSTLLPALDLTTSDQIPITTPARTVVDGSAHQDPRVVGLWLDEAMRRRLVDLREVRSCVARLAGPGRRDLRPVRTALAQRLPGYDPGDSELEVRALRALAAAGLPAPVQQHEVRRPDGRRARIDLAYPDAMVAIELDGWDAHGRRSAFDSDRIRRNELTLLGWRVYQFTSTMSDADLVRTVSDALQAAGHQVVAD